jgi:L-fuconolactonase
MQRFPGRFSPVVIVDTDKPDAPETLTPLVSEGAQGVPLSPTTRSPGNDPLAIWRKAAELGISVSCLGSSEVFTSPLLTQVAKEFPSLSIIIEHLGGIGRDEAPPYTTFHKILDLAH